MKPVSRGIDRIAVTFDDPNLVANAGLLLIATLVAKLRLAGRLRRIRIHAITVREDECVLPALHPHLEDHVDVGSASPGFRSDL